MGNAVNMLEYPKTRRATESLAIRQGELLLKRFAASRGYSNLQKNLLRVFGYSHAASKVRTLC